MSDSCQVIDGPMLDMRGSTPLRALFVEDNQSLLASVFAHLERRGFVLDAAPDGVSGLQIAMQGDYDVVVLDWMLPRMEGIEVLRELRRHGVDVPVLVLTARDKLDSKIEGFRSGADDYLAKPFALAELEARLIALSYRRAGRQRVLEVDDVRFNLQTQQIHRGKRELKLFSGSRAILEVLMRESPGVVSKERLEFAIWGDDRPDKELLRAHIYELRKRLELDGERKLLHTINKQGYRLAAIDSDA